MDCLVAVQKQIIKFGRDAKVKRLWRERVLEKERKKERYQFWKLPH
jgi:hypothetical protein